MSLKVNNEEVSDYVKAMMVGIIQGVPEGHVITSGVRFHIGISNEVKVEGGVKIVVAHIGADKSSSADSFVEFEIGPKGEGLGSPTE